MLARLAGILALLSAPNALLAEARPIDRVVAAHYPPLMIEDAADQPGYALEVLREAARRAGREVDVRFLPFQRAIYEVLNSNSTLMPALFKGKEHDDDILWVAQVHETSLRFSATHSRINSLDEARALTSIVVERGTTSENLLTQLEFDNLHRSSSPEASANMLASGRADAWLLTEEMMQQVWRKLEMGKPLKIGDDVHAIPVFMVANAELPADMLDAYRTAIDAMDADGTLTRIWQSYTVQSN